MPLRIFLSLCLLFLYVQPALAQSLDVKIKIDGPLPDQMKLLERLNKNGRKHDIRFVLSESEYDFRIAVATGTPGFTESFFYGEQGQEATAAVLTPDCRLLFIASRKGRMTRGGALNALSKQIVRNLARYVRATR